LASASAQLIPLQLGLLAENSEQRQALKHLVCGAGHKVTVATLASEADAALLASPVDAWLIDIDLTKYTAIEGWLSHLQQPVIISDGWELQPATDAYRLWVRRLQAKLRQLDGQINLLQHPVGATRDLWVLGASTGGVEAVRDFFSALPPALGIGFIYVQHIDSGYEQSLADMVNKYSHYPAYPVLHGDVIHPDRTAIVASDRHIIVQDNGTLSVSGDVWSGPYSPSIDQVFANVALSHGAHSGVIVFSGMGDDGTSGARLIKQKGGCVWVQSPDSCVVSSMPDEVINAELAEVVATPQGLAARLAQHYAERV